MMAIPSLSIEELNSQPKKFATAMKTGFFYLEIPESCRPLIQKALQFSNEFHKNKQLRQFNRNPQSRFDRSTSNQVQSIYAEKQFWDELYPATVQKLAEKMHKLAVEVIKQVFIACEVPEDQWGKASSGLMKNEGMQHLFFNHYRSEMNKPGLIGHTDPVFVTILFIHQKGLQAKINRKWVNVNPKKNHFVINFGKAFEIVINNRKKVRAIYHRVLQVEDRTSYGLFVNGTRHSKLYKITKDKKLVVVYNDYERFLIDSSQKVGDRRLSAMKRKK